MNTDTLLKPRYKVIADYPDSKYSVGDILPGCFSDWDEDADDDFIDEQMRHVKKFPHLFRRLEWWEERSVDEMPRYIKHKLGGYHEVFQWHKNSKDVWICDAKIAYFFIGDIVPITEEEYSKFEEYQTQNKKT
jgi:hypothetical protein